MTTTAPPVEVSAEAHLVLADLIREWSGWTDATLTFGPTNPAVSPWATTNHLTREFVADPESLVLNPNRVLLTVTPFRLRQEAVLTGTLLHEAAHARHSKWRPRTAEEAALWVHEDDTPVTPQENALATLMEEARIEGIIAREAANIGAPGLAWTMRAMAAYLLPMTQVHLTDSGQQVMDVMSSWAVRAGRHLALASHTQYTVPSWVGHFTSLLFNTIESHLAGAGVSDDPGADAREVIRLVTNMVEAGIGADKGTFMVDKARDILALLFPETDPEDMPSPEGGCSEPGDEDTEPAPGEAEEGQEGTGDDEGTDAPSESPDAGDGGSEPGEGDAEGDAEGEGESASPSTEGSEGTGNGEPSELAEALATLEAMSDETEQEMAEHEAKQPPSTERGGQQGGTGDGSGGATRGYRTPDASERETKKNAEKFLRSLISPTEASKVRLTESPSATVDGAELAAWRAGGQVRDPRFFRRVRRTVQPSPPVQIAVLVDVSASMEELQAPSALLSWALASAAIDLRNFAGRGQQVESCLIHWGDRADVIQATGAIMPGIREVDCDQGTSGMHLAHAAVEEQMPGFFDVSPTPVNRLLVHFTDWLLGGPCNRLIIPQFQQAFDAGVNLLSVVPQRYSHRHTSLNDVMAQCPTGGGLSTVMQYNPAYPEQVWETAARALSGRGGAFGE